MVLTDYTTNDHSIWNYHCKKKIWLIFGLKIKQGWKYELILEYIQYILVIEFFEKKLVIYL